MIERLLLLLFVLPVIANGCTTSRTLTNYTDGDTTCLSNRFLYMLVDREGRLTFGGSILGDGSDDDAEVGSITLDPLPASVDVDSGEGYVQVNSGFGDSDMHDTITITLSEDDRFFEVTTSTNGNPSMTIPFYRNFLFKTSSITAFYEGGPVQMKDANKDEGFFYSGENLLRVYSLGAEGGDVSDTIPSRALNAGVDIMFEEEASKSIIISGSSNLDDEEYLSGFKTVLIGDLPSGKMDVWGAELDVSASASAHSSSSTSSFKLGATNRDLPSLSIPQDWSPSSLPLVDLQSYLTGIYASPVGCLCTHVNQVEEGQTLGQIATTIARPDRGYSDTYNYFDPDNYISTSAILLSMEPYLQAEVKKVLMRNGDMMNTTTGQLPHHFEGANPVYQALSGEIQTGPNVFWVMSCFNYAKTSGDLDWLKSYMPTLRTATNFLYDLFQEDADFKLASVPGSLMVDVFLRSNYTSDTNAMLVGFFREFADAEEATGNSTGAEDLRDLADDISEALMAHLWDTADDDHFITQLNPDGTTRDLVDYDSNLMATAHQVTNAEQAKKVLARVDSGQCRKGVTFVSEVWYGEDDTTGGNTGDSWCAMGRHAWFDSLSRKLYDTYENFEALILDPLQTHLTESTFLHERLACDGTQQQNRTAMYFEYPSVTAMITMKIKYGLEPGLTDFKVHPFYSSSPVFRWQAENILVDFSPAEVTLSLARGLHAKDTAETTISLTKLLADSDFSVKNNCENEVQEVQSDSTGSLEFDTTMGLKCEVTIKAMA
ncbi:hypothetical protein TrVE_jg12681 [Triparma verrucosa]|uniref:Uncharacterized protein n=1 Tax=Triparma verrucosa TaxID=1606542 RepID=A0A9W7BV82_9STRA|nr:hypothetical protein TrVE_jg12681 [Triparma verrucosa]